VIPRFVERGLRAYLICGILAHGIVDSSLPSDEVSTKPGQLQEPGGKILWELHNPHRAGRCDQHIAPLFEMLRLSPEFPTGWARESD
jgi:hypothetical protein